MYAHVAALPVEEVVAFAGPVVTTALVVLRAYVHRVAAVMNTNAPAARGAEACAKEAEHVGH